MVKPSIDQLLYIFITVVKCIVYLVVLIRLVLRIKDIIKENIECDINRFDSERKVLQVLNENNKT